MVHFLLYGFVSHEVSKELARQRSDAADVVVAIIPSPGYPPLAQSLLVGPGTLLVAVEDVSNLGVSEVVAVVGRVVVLGDLGEIHVSELVRVEDGSEEDGHEHALGGAHGPGVGT